jgi:hypothetical protein
MSPILDATSLLPTGIAFDMVVDMIVEGCHKRYCVHDSGVTLMEGRKFEASGMVTCDW